MKKKIQYNVDIYIPSNKKKSKHYITIIKPYVSNGWIYLETADEEIIETTTGVEKITVTPFI